MFTKDYSYDRETGYCINIFTDAGDYDTMMIQYQGEKRAHFYDNQKRFTTTGRMDKMMITKKVCQFYFAKKDIPDLIKATLLGSLTARTILNYVRKQ